ncbi:MAG: HAMP domain-containing sensor histidine kinase [Bacteroides sp.]
MKRLTLIFALCGCALLMYAKATIKPDTLMQHFHKLPHDSTRLVLLYESMLVEQKSPRCITLSNILLKEATSQKNNKYIGTALYFQLIYYYNQNELDSVSKRVVAMEPFVRKSNLWNYFFDGKRCEIDLYSYKEQYELAINKSLQMRKEAEQQHNILGVIGAYQALANAYMKSGRMELGKQALINAHQLLPQIHHVVVINAVLAQLISLSKENKEYSDMINYLKEQAIILSNYVAKHPTMSDAFKDPILFNEIYHSYYYIGMKQPQQALVHLQKAKNLYITPHTYYMYKVLYDDAFAGYYRLCRQYDLALERIDSTLIPLKKDFGNDYYYQLSTKADILAESGRSLEALPIYQEVLKAKDSLQNEISNNQMKLIQENYHVDKMMLEKEQLKSKIQIIALVIFILALILLTYFMFRIIHIRKALNLSEHQTRESTRIAEEANEMKNRFLFNMSYNIRIPLNGVVGFSQLIASEPCIDEDSRKEYCTIIQKNSEELMRLVNDVLDLSRLEAKMMKFQMQECDVTELFNDVVYTSQVHSDNDTRLLFQNEIEGTQTLTIDQSRLTQALLSTLVLPQQSNKVHEIKCTLSMDNNTKAIRFCINNSPLADPQNFSQEVSIRHDINRLLLEHFGGSYTVMAGAPEGPTILFTYPLTISS